MENENKLCCHCKYVSTLYNEEPCKSCRARSNWQSNVKFKTGDVVVSPKGNLYIYLRNKWVLRIPCNVIINGVFCDDYLSNHTIDKLISNRKVDCSWLDDIEYASPEMVLQHDFNAMHMIYNTLSLHDWLSERLDEEPKKIDETFTLPKRSTTDPKTTYKYNGGWTVKDPGLGYKDYGNRYDKFPTLNGNFIKNVIFSDPATIIFWEDGTKTVVKTQDGEKYDKEKGFAMAVCKKVFGNERDYYNVFKRWMRKGKEVK